MAAIPWSQVEPYVERAFGKHGIIERADVIDEAYAENASDDLVDVIDAIGSRVFRSPEDVRRFLESQSLVSN